MMFAVPPPQPTGQPIPPKIQAAFSYLEYVARLRGEAGNSTSIVLGGGGEKWQGGGNDEDEAKRTLSRQESQVYANALGALNVYFQSPGFGDAPTVTPMPGDLSEGFNPYPPTM